jgi:hypothetical protein
LTLSAFRAVTATQTEVEEWTCVRETLHHRVEETGIAQVSHAIRDSFGTWLINDITICHFIRDYFNSSSFTLFNLTFILRWLSLIRGILSCMASTP